MDDQELERMAAEADAAAEEEFSRRLRKIEDYRYDEVQEKYWDITTSTLLGAKSVDGSIPRGDWPTTENAKGKVIPVRPSIAINDILTGLTVETSTWWPGSHQFIDNVMVTSRGALKKKGARTYNTYVAPDWSGLAERRDIPKPEPWINHVKKLWPAPIEHNGFFDFAAHMIQRPDQKVNHGVVIAGAQGIGKDTALHPLRVGVGDWNAAEVDPDSVSGQYNSFIKSVLLVINEVRPHDEDHKSSNFYNQLKPLLASPPEMLPMEKKYQNVIYVRNVCHVILTTNEPLTMYVPGEDRRLLVLTSPLPDPKINEVFKAGYFTELWNWLQEEQGELAVIRWLMERDISGFSRNEPPPMTDGKQAIIDSAHQIRRTAVDDLIDRYVEWWADSVEVSEGSDLKTRPPVIFAKDLFDFLAVGKFFDDVPSMRKMLTAKNFHFKMDEHGYDMAKNPFAAQWKCRKYRSRMAFVDKSLPQEGRYDVIHEELQRRPLDFGDL